MVKSQDRWGDVDRGEAFPLSVYPCCEPDLPKCAGCHADLLTGVVTVALQDGAGRCRTAQNDAGRVHAHVIQDVPDR